MQWHQLHHMQTICTSFQTDNHTNTSSLNFYMLLLMPKQQCQINNNYNTRLTALCPGLPGRASTRKVKPTWILVKHEKVSGSGISWAICKSAPRSREITMPAPHHTVFLQVGCPSCHPTNSVKALKATLALGENDC